MASLLEISMNQIDLKNKDATKEDFEEELKNMDNEDYEIMSKFEIESTIEYVDNMKVYVYDAHLESSGDINNTIVYLHGGAYVLQINELQVNTAVKLATKSNSKLYIPIYPLAPNHTAEEAYDLLEKLYLKVLAENENSKIIMAGDSAGGGLALGLSQYFVEKNIYTPDKLILLSPWVDISMENEEIANYEEVDPMLNKTALFVEGEAWRGYLSNKDYKVSPIYGNFDGIKDTIIFVGTREILYPDITLLYEKMKEAGVNVSLEIGENMNHVYVGYPIKEAEEAIEKIIEFVK